MWYVYIVLFFDVNFINKNIVFCQLLKKFILQIVLSDSDSDGLTKEENEMLHVLMAKKERKAQSRNKEVSKKAKVVSDVTACSKANLFSDNLKVNWNYVIQLYCWKFFIWSITKKLFFHLGQRFFFMSSNFNT